METHKMTPNQTKILEGMDKDLRQINRVQKENEHRTCDSKR